VNLFDRIASAVSRQVAHAWFFCLCVLMIVLWAPSIFFGLSLDTWQLIINTITTIITFLLVALLQNSSQQFENATNKKLDAQTRAIAVLLHSQTPNYGIAKPQLEQAARELEESIGVEERTGASE